MPYADINVRSGIYGITWPEYWDIVLILERREISSAIFKNGIGAISETGQEICVQKA